MDSPWVQPGEVLLHIGPHKTGTTALQSAFAASREELQQEGVRYPGSKGSHWHAAAAALGRNVGGGFVPDEDLWTQVCQDATAPDERILVSSELFCEATDDGAARIVADLGGPDRVKVVLVLRSLEKLLPSTWQQAVKSGIARDYETWLHATLDTPGRAWVWRRLDTAALVRRWGGVVGMDRVTAIVLDDGDPAAVRTAFAGLIGVSADLLAPGDTSNRSLSAAEAHAVQRVYGRLGDALPDRLRQRWLRRGGILQMVEHFTPAADEPRVVTPAWAVHRAREVQAELNEAVAATGAHVIGDLAGLVGRSEVPGDGATVFPDRLPAAAVAELVTGVLLAAQADQDRAEERLARERQRRRRDLERLEEARARVAALREAREAARTAPPDLARASSKAMLREFGRRARPGR